MVRGIVLALREEEGLKALIQGQPAAMARVCGRPAAEYAVDLLAKAGKEAHLTLSQQSRDFRGGVVLADGDVEVNCTFETLVRLARGSVSGEVAKVLFA